MTFQEKLTQFFKDKKITNVEVAEATGYTPTMVGRYFKYLDPNYKFMMALNLNYEIDWNYLLKDNYVVNEDVAQYQKSPEILLKEIENRVNQLKEWHKNDTQNK